MRLLALITEDWDEITDAITEVRTRLGDLDIIIDTSRVDPDLSNDSVYHTTSAWTWLKRKTFKTISPAWINLLGDIHKTMEYDGYIVICDKKKVQSDPSVNGEYTFFDDKHILEVYGNKTKRKHWGLQFTAYNLIHEILHAMDYERGAGPTALHDYLLESKTLDAYIEGFKKKDIADLLPTINKRAKGLVLMMKMWGMPIRVTEGFRSYERQNELYEQGRTTPGSIVTNAKGGESYHNFGVAFDVVFREKGYDAPQKDWERLGQFGKILGLSWGGDWTGFVDRPHFQFTKGYGLEQFRKGEVDLSKFN